MNPSTASDSIGKQLEALTPKCLDDIFRSNREFGTVALANKAQLAPLLNPVPGRPVIRGAVDDWRFIAVTFDIPHKAFWQQRLYLHGTLGGESWITSSVEAIDLKRKRVRTRNSVYELNGPQGEGEPDSYGLIYICGAFNTWGWGPMFGVPAVFF
jgi:hypothetical protein